MLQATLVRETRPPGVPIVWEARAAAATCVAAADANGVLVWSPRDDDHGPSLLSPWPAFGGNADVYGVDVRLLHDRRPLLAACADCPGTGRCAVAVGRLEDDAAPPIDVRDLDTSPNDVALDVGRGRLLVGSFHGIHVADVEEGRRGDLIEPRVPIDAVESVAVGAAAAEHCVAFATSEGAAGHVDMRSRAIVRLGAVGDANLWQAAWSPCGRRMALAGSRHVCLYDIAMPSVPLAIVDQHGATATVDFSPSGRHLLAAAGNAVRLWLVNDLGLEPPAPVVDQTVADAGINAAYFAGATSVLVSGQQAQGQACIWSLDVSEPVGFRPYQHATQRRWRSVRASS